MRQDPGVTRPSIAQPPSITRCCPEPPEASTIDDVDIRRVEAEVTRPLRHSVLRPHQDPAELVYPGDDLPETWHGAVLEKGRAIGTASMYREGHPNLPPAFSWRLRGMAVAPEWRGRGLGTALLAAALEHVESIDDQGVWCNARTPAVAFYQRHGFRTVGDEFEPPDIGPHFLMIRPGSRTDEFAGRSPG